MTDLELGDDRKLLGSGDQLDQIVLDEQLDEKPFVRGHGAKVEEGIGRDGQGDIPG